VENLEWAMKFKFCDLPKEPITVGDTLIVNLEKVFPQCKQETERQKIPQFSCCDPKRETMCDFVAQCQFARGAVQQRLIEKPKHKVFVGWGENFVVVWWTVLPVLTQSRRVVDLETFFGPLLAIGGSRVKDLDDGNANDDSQQ
jgi:hypothetical protein